MDSSGFTASEVENLQRLIDENQAAELIKDEHQIKDSDILFFSQFGHLDGTVEDPNFPILQGIDDTTANSKDSFTLNAPDPLNQVMQSNVGIVDFPETSSLDSTQSAVKKEPVLNFGHTKYREQDGKNTKVFECETCGKEFGHQYTLMRHLPTHTDERKFHCLICGKSFRQMSTLSQHRAIHSSERPYVCEVCNKNFNRVSTLISHRKTHTGVKPHRCHLCNKAFHQKGNLRNHIFTHTNERPYKCDICNKGFNQMSNLMCHKMKAHQNQNYVIPRYKCKVCGEEFLKRIHLRQHEQYKHGMNNAAVDSNFMDYSNAIIVDPIKTDAMKLAIMSGNTPFALLRPLSGIPVLVRVIPADDKQMLVPATAEDLKKYGHISIRPKVGESKTGDAQNKQNQAAQAQKTKGCVVQIKVPVVATVIQKTGGVNGPVSMNVLSPGPGDILDERGGNMSDLNADSFVYTSTLTEEMFGGGGVIDQSNKGTEQPIDSFAFDDKYDNLIGTVADAHIEFVDQSGNIVDGNDFHQKNLDINSMEFCFDIPQDARDDVTCPARERTSEELMFTAPSDNNQEVVAEKLGISDNSSVIGHDIPDKIVIEENGQFIEL